MKTHDEALAEARAEGLAVDDWDEAQVAGYHFAKLPLEVRLQNACRGCGGALVRDPVRTLAFVLGPPKPGRCVACGWVGTKPSYYVEVDGETSGPFATYDEAAYQAVQTGGTVTTNSGVTRGSVGTPSH